ncbi:MAG: hypothetical protein ABW123_13810 [Cystobacter sp.]
MSRAAAPRKPTGGVLSFLGFCLTPASGATLASSAPAWGRVTLLSSSPVWGSPPPSGGANAGQAVMDAWVEAVTAQANQKGLF